MKWNPFIPALSCLLAALPLGNSDLSAADLVSVAKVSGAADYLREDTIALAGIWRWW